MFKKLLTAAGLLASAAVLYYFNKDPERIEVEFYTVKAGEVSATVSNTRVGTVKACRRAYLAPATGGQVAGLHVEKGELVKKNQLLLEVWNADLKAQVELNKAKIKASYTEAEQVCQRAAGAEREAARFSKLRSRNQFISEDQLDKSVTEAKAQKAQCQGAEQAIEVSKAQLAVSQAAVERTFITAPFDGTVAEINAELGEFVTPSPPGIPTLPAIDLLDLSCLYISAPIDEVDAGRIRIGMQACVSLDAFPEKRCTGKVSRLAPYVQEKEKQARTVEVEVKITDADDLKRWLPGYSADIEVVLAEKQNALRLPAEAIMENSKVLLIAQGDVLEERTFVPGLSNWSFTEIESGLQEGDRVVTSVGKEGVAAGSKVRFAP
jgi:HlyD family secretion protein